MSHLVGQQAPRFGTLLDQDGQSFDVDSLLGKQALCIFFYPAALTYGASHTILRFLRGISD
jgi:peroxiredoxin